MNVSPSSPLAPGVSAQSASGGIVVRPLGQTIDSRREKPGRTGGSWFRPRSDVGDDWGRSESFDPDNVGDIADEGLGHRG
jgi:hypothetical protein